MDGADDVIEFPAAGELGWARWARAIRKATADAGYPKKATDWIIRDMRTRYLALDQAVEVNCEALVWIDPPDREQIEQAVREAGDALRLRYLAAFIEMELALWKALHGGGAKADT
jgi:hypothetical protein